MPARETDKPIPARTHRLGLRTGELNFRLARLGLHRRYSLNGRVLRLGGTGIEVAQVWRLSHGEGGGEDAELILDDQADVVFGALSELPVLWEDYFRNSRTGAQTLAGSLNSEHERLASSLRSEVLEFHGYWSAPPVGCLQIIDLLAADENLDAETYRRILAGLPDRSGDQVIAIALRHWSAGYAAAMELIDH